MRLFWCDIETSGLLPDSDSILEIAVATADLADPFNIKHVYQAVLRVPCRHEELDPFILAMHTKSGLLDACERDYTERDDVESDLLAKVPYVDKYEDKPVLAGSSVHFDHGFLKRHMPSLAKRFSHRYYDVSAVKLFCRSLGMDPLPKAEAHRAKADIEESVTHALQCSEWLKRWGRDAVARGILESLR